MFRIYEQFHYGINSDISKNKQLFQSLGSSSDELTTDRREWKTVNGASNPNKLGKEQEAEVCIELLKVGVFLCIL
jgi:hypothetical protein